MSECDIRTRCREILREHLGDSSEITDEIEDSCWSHALALCDGPSSCHSSAYLQVFAKVLANLTGDDSIWNGNDYARERLREGDRQYLLTMAGKTAHELNPSAFPRGKTKCHRRSTIGESDIFECPRCRARKSIHYEMQTRSADEATTIFIMCTSCGHKWTE